MLDVGDPGDLRGDRAGHLGRVVDQEVGPPVGDDPPEVREHRLDPDAGEQARDDVPDLVLRRDVAPVRLGPVEAVPGDRHVEPGREGLEPDPPDVLAEPRIGRERHRVAGRLEGPREGHHRVEVPRPTTQVKRTRTARGYAVRLQQAHNAFNRRCGCPRGCHVATGGAPCPDGPHSLRSPCS